MIKDKNEIRNKIHSTCKDAILREKFEVLMYLIVPFKEAQVLPKISVFSQIPLATETLLAGRTVLCKIQCMN